MDSTTEATKFHIAADTKQGLEMGAEGIEGAMNLATTPHLDFCGVIPKLILFFSI